MQATFLPPRNPALCAPLTSNRELAACLIANIPILELLSVELRKAGFQLVEPYEAGPKTIRIPIDTWVELGALLMLGRSEKSVRLCNQNGEILAWKGCDTAAECEQEIHTQAISFAIVYPWDLLKMNEEVVSMMDENLLAGEISPLATISGCVRIAATAVIHPGTVIEGPVIVGPGTHIGPNALIRGATTIGANCYIGHSAEVKNSIIYPNSYISRHCYIGDSIIGSHVTLGAGTRTENHRHDGRHHTSQVRGECIDTGRLKFGAMIGDGVRTGVNTSIDAGIKIGVARTTKPGTYVDKDML